MQARGTLKESGMKVTSAREAVLYLLSQATHPMDVAEIKEGLEKQSISVDQATVYRILKKFVDGNLVRAVQLQEDKLRYELASLPHHHHLVCQNCGKIDDIEDCNLEEIEQEISKTKHFQITTHKLEFFGLCESCQS